jgi:sulfate/thiosulfate transport system permease protein
MIDSSQYPYQTQAATREPTWLRYTLIGIAVAFMTLMLVIPLISVFYEALKSGWQLYVAALTDHEALSAIKLTLITALIVVPINTVIGIADTVARGLNRMHLYRCQFCQNIGHFF